MLFSVEQAFVGREEIRAPLKMPAGEARHGWAKVVYTTKSIRAKPIFLVRILFSSEPCQKFSAV